MMASEVSAGWEAGMPAREVVAYDGVAILLHWLMAVLIVGLFLLGLYMTDLGYYDRWYHDAPDLHKSVGVIVMLLLFWRLFWRLWRPYPGPIGRCWERFLARLVHAGHYLLMLVVVVSGYLLPTAKGEGVDVFGLLTVPSLLRLDGAQSDWVGWLHWQASWLLIGLLVLHVLAAFKHHLIDKDPTLLRMLGKVRR